MMATTSHPPHRWYRLTGLLLCLGLLAGCAERPRRTPDMAEAIRTEIAPAAAATATGTVPSRVSDALAEPAPPAAVVPPEPRLDLLVNNASAREVFLALVADTRYSMLMHPEVTGSISVTLRGVTVKEALESIRDVYGYDFRMEGRRITIYAPTLQTRIFTLNYPHAQRVGRSELRVASGAALVGQGVAGTAGAVNPAAAVPGTGVGAGAQARQAESSRISTDSKSDFWAELSDAVRGLVGRGEGRNVVISPQAGIMAVRAMPDELRQVDRFLKATQVAVERQVMLEAKIVEVELNEGQQSGINWGAFSSSGNRGIGVIGGGVTSSNALLSNVQPASGVNPVPVPSIASGGGIFGLALQTSQFGTVMGFLESQGDVQTLSSPRVATLNNQKAVLKVGNDDYFVTNVTGGTTTSSGVVGVAGSTTLPTLTLTPFFSGIALDVTPQIDDANSIMLHIHPAVTSVTEKTKQVDLGDIGTYRLPLASSTVNETDTMVRLQDGNIAAIGGLMQQSSSRSASGVPGSTGEGNPFGFLLGNRASAARKKEIVVLIKPTIIRSPQDWEAITERSRAALEDIDASRRKVIRIDGSVQEAPAKPAAR
ncbi:MAG: secretin N-terminal domain-containing protein [Hylemonella sp.]|uniref:secretin N-terminal domain-containing protein n=1 Tax=Hylemonella sp. TaxID=2066020 RepID=UPI0022C2288B|nr:secretin N-terminal domain-containing protein [Hylemonella sp.]MCZ8251859.1 secretin N-terminal domain-containing protein [Hylemonella sp.]